MASGPSSHDDTRRDHRDSAAVTDTAVVGLVTRTVTGRDPDTELLFGVPQSPKILKVKTSKDCKTQNYKNIEALFHAKRSELQLP